MTALRDELGTDPPDGLVAALSDAQCDELAAALRDARERQSAELQRASRDAFKHVPFFARGIVKKLVFG